MKLVVVGCVSHYLHSASFSPVFAQAPTPTVVDSPTVKVLTGLLAPQFQEEMNFITQALGVTCNTCHARGNFASDEKPEKLTARRMLEMTKAHQQAVLPRSQTETRRIGAGPGHLLHLPPGRTHTQTSSRTLNLIHCAVHVDRRVSRCALPVSLSPLAGSARARRSCSFLTHAALYKHTSLGPAEKAVTELGKAGGFEVTTVEGYKQDSKQLDFSFLTPEYLNQFDGVMMMTNGNLPFTDAQKKNLVDFVRGGKALIGAHCASLTFYNYPEFGEMLGGYFNRNLPQGTIAVLKVEDSKHPATKMLGASWPLVDEFYLFGTAPWDAARPDENIDVLFKNKIPMGFSRDKVHVLLSLDTERMDLTKQPNLKRGGDYPQAWTKEVGKGRTFYTSLGHRDDIWSNDPVFRAHINGGIRWALGLEQ